MSAQILVYMSWEKVAYWSNVCSRGKTRNLFNVHHPLEMM